MGKKIKTWSVTNLVVMTLKRPSQTKPSFYFQHTQNNTPDLENRSLQNTPPSAHNPTKTRESIPSDICFCISTQHQNTKFQKHIPNTNNPPVETGYRQGGIDTRPVS